MKIAVYFNPTRVFIDNKECKTHYLSNRKNSIWYCREIFIYKDILIKLDDDYGQSTAELNTINRVSDKYLKYFPTIVGGQRRVRKTPGWIAEKMICPVPGRRPEWAYEIVEKISNRYKFCDADAGRNWCMTNTGPIIYDWGI